MLGRTLTALARIARRGAKTSVAELRRGDYIDHGGRALVVHSVSSAHSGRGTRTYSLTLREPAASAVATTLRLSAKDSVERHEGLRDLAGTFLYASDAGRIAHVVSDAASGCVELAVPVAAVAGGAHVVGLLEGGAPVRVRVLADGTPVLATPQSRAMTATVVEVLDDRTGDADRKRHTIVRTAGGARVSANVVLAVGDRITVNADDLSYMGKALS